jgi:CysZ protein
MSDRPVVVRAAPRSGGRLAGGLICLGRGFGLLVRAPGLWLLGLLPALLALAVLALALSAAFGFGLVRAVVLLTWFAAGWPQPERDALRLLVGSVLVVGSVWLAIVSYVALTQAIGQPFYEAIAGKVEAREGLPPPVTESPWWLSIGRAAWDGLLMIGLSMGLGLVLFVLGLVPVVGETVVPVLSACVAAWLLALELTQPALERRGYRLAQRLGLVWRHRLLCLGFGLGVLLIFLLPLGAVACMPPAVAGGTLLARRLAG